MNISHLRKMFRDLFERQGFVDDREYDWDVLLNKVAGSQCRLVFIIYIVIRHNVIYHSSG